MIRILIGLVAAVTLMPVQALAAPILVPPGTSVTLNWDLTAESPAPPYDQIAFDFAWSDAASNFDVLLELFPELDAGGLVAQTFNLGFTGCASPCWGSINLGVTPFAFAGGMDGIFSVRFSYTTIEPIPLQLDVATAQGTNSSGNSEVVTGTLSEAVVPEPASIVLLGIGLLGVGARRWRQTRA